VRRPGIFILAGPCVIESPEHTLKLARNIAKVAEAKGVPLIFKASFDKANRTSIDSPRGPGMKDGLEVLAAVRREVGVPVVTDIHEPSQAGPVAEVVDLLADPGVPVPSDRPARRRRAHGQAGEREEGPVPRAGRHGARRAGKLEEAGATKILLTERGASFGYNNLVTDMRSLVIMSRLGRPGRLRRDAQRADARGGGGGERRQPEFIAPLVRAAVAVGVAGVFMEVHDQPAKALSDGANALALERLPKMLDAMLAIDAARRQCGQLSARERAWRGAGFVLEFWACLRPSPEAGFSAMPFAAAIKFKDNGASKYFHPGDLGLEADDFVWVKDPGVGVERIGFVSSMEGRAAIQMLHLPKVLRYAGEDEIERWYELKIEEREMIEVARERARAHDLPIKISDLVFVEERRQVIIQFTSDTGSISASWSRTSPVTSRRGSRCGRSVRGEKRG
jgi:2-dehydro-3-deoxyphosphooctonate aldolase (KDO 8-P synthase)